MDGFPSASARACQNNFLRGLKASPQDVPSFCVGRLGLKKPDVCRLTESGATPPASVALLLLLAFPLLLQLHQLEVTGNTLVLLYIINRAFLQTVQKFYCPISASL